MLKPLIEQVKERGGRVNRIYGDGGYERWKDKYRYGYRWSAECFFPGIKRVFGERCRARSKDALFQEVKMKFILLLNSLNIPPWERLAGGMHLPSNCSIQWFSKTD